MPGLLVVYLRLQPDVEVVRSVRARDAVADFAASQSKTVLQPLLLVTKLPP
jgi:hypothetical protein